MRELGEERPPPHVVKPNHKVIRLDTIVNQEVTQRNYTELEDFGEVAYNQKLGEDRILKAKETVNEATHLLEQAKEGFYEMDRKQREKIAEQPKPVMINAESHKYLESQRPEMLKILLPEVFKEKEPEPVAVPEPTPEPEEVPEAVDDLLVNVEDKLDQLGREVVPLGVSGAINVSYAAQSQHSSQFDQYADAVSPLDRRRAASNLSRRSQHDSPTASSK